jgi:hypothetical protein
MVVHHLEIGNRAMADKLIRGEANDVSECARDGDYYVLETFVEGRDYCDARTESWIWSIGKRHADGVILASLRGDLYQNPDFECLWLR